jgi:hypothetical protein
VGPALGQHGVNIMEFCKAFNAETQGTEPGLPIPVVITVYNDRSFTFIKKTPPASVLLRKVAGIAKGSGDAEHQQGRQGDARAARGSGARRSGRTSRPPIWTPPCARSPAALVPQVSTSRG